MSDVLKRHPSGCPKLLLAPMEGVGSKPFRKAIATVGGFDEATTEFIRVPTNAHIPSLSSKYNPSELNPIPLAAQVMGSDLELMPQMVEALVKAGAKRIDLNCGCPSKTVTGRGAGSSLLKDPKFLFHVAKSMRQVCPVVFSIKLRSGFEDTTLFEDIVLAAQESGADFITLHPRTKVEGYKPPANWSLIAKAKHLLSIPVVGNGDINTVDDALRMLETTNCDALMIGRGAVKDPWIFQKIKAHYANENHVECFQDLSNYLQAFQETIPEDTKLRSRINQFKQLSGFLLEKTEALRNEKKPFLRTPFGSLEEIRSSLEHIYLKTAFS